jgi:hypothetical protein
MSNASLPSNLTVNRTRFTRVLVTSKPTFDALSETSATSGWVTTSAGLLHVTLSPALHPARRNVATGAASIRLTCTVSSAGVRST